MNEKAAPQYDFRMIVYGGNRQTVREKFEFHLGLSDEIEFYQTWISVAMMRRLGFLFEGGVESAMGVFEIVCMFAILFLVLAIFVFWQVIILFIVLLVLSILSGGAAMKYTKATYYGAYGKNIDISQLEGLVKDLLQAGAFVYISADAFKNEFGPITRNASRNATLFRCGISLALFIATVFLIIEVAYRLIYGSWSYNILPLLAFGILFLTGIILLDTGVMLNYQLKKSVRESKDELA